MRLRYVPGSEDALRECGYVVCQEDSEGGFNWDEIFGRRAPLRLEIGTGKGGFITQCAREYPDINFIGMEKFSSVLVKALPQAKEISNLRLFWADAEKLTEYFKPNSVEKIYLNFSDPWPKKKHAKRRLTSPGYLEMYRTVLLGGGTIEFKTDNTDLFAYSLETAKECGWKVEAVSYDLHSDPVMCAGNIMTEYERKFSAKGNPIAKAIFGK